MAPTFRSTLITLALLVAFATPTAAGYVWYRDHDQDGFGDPGYTAYGIYPPVGYVENGEDCDDYNPEAYPGAFDVPCNGIDEDCSGGDATASVNGVPDADGDGYGDRSATPTAFACMLASGYVPTSLATDCNDGDASIHPGAVETCDQIDNDCNASIDEDCASSGVGRLPLGVLALSPPVPNPVHGTARLFFGLPSQAAVRVIVFDVQGHPVRTLVDAILSAGIHSADWDRRNDRSSLVASGMYFVRLEALGRTIAVRVAVVQ